MRKIVSIIILSIVGLLVLFAALLPTLVSSSWGRSQLVSLVNKRIPGKIAISNLSLGWLGPQEIKGVTLKDPDEITILSLETATVNTSFFALLRNPYNIGNIEFHAFNASLISDSEGNTNLMRALDAQCCAPADKNKSAPVVVAMKNVQGVLNLSSHETPLTIKISGETEQGVLKGTFNIDAELIGITPEQLVKHESNVAEFLHSNPDVDLKIHADILNFPVELLDQIATLRAPKYAGMLTELLGKQLNLTVQQKATPSGIFVSLNANTPTLSADADVSITNDITLMKPVMVSLKVTPQFIDELLRASNAPPQWHLASPTTANLTLKRFTMPLGSLNLDAIALGAELEIATADFVSDKSTNVALKGVRATAAAEAGSPTATVTLKAQGMSNQQPTNVNVSVTAAKSLLLEDISALSLKGIALEGQISGAPLFLLDQYVEGPGVVSEGLGSIADLAFSIREVDQKPLATLQFKSEKLEISNCAFWLEKQITLQHPTFAVLKLPSSFINRFFKDVSTRVQNPVTAQLALNTFSLPLAALKNFSAAPITSIYKITLDAEMTITPIQLISVPTIGSANINDISVKIMAAPNSRPEINATASIFPNGAGRLYDLIGKKGVVNADASFGISLDGKPTISVFNLRFVSDLGRIDMSGEVRDGNRIILNSPAVISYMFNSSSLQTLGLSTDNYVITQGAPLKLTVETSHIPLDTDDLSMLRLGGTLKIDELKVANRTQKGYPQAVLENLTANWNIDAAAQKISLNFLGITRLGENEGAGKLNGVLTINHWIYEGRPDFTKAVMIVNTQASNLPTQLISSLSGNGDLVPLIGSAIDVNMQARVAFDGTTEGLLDLDIKSDNLSGSILLSIGDVIRLKEGGPAEFNLKLTQDGYGALRERIKDGSSADFTLAEISNISIKLKSLNIPLNHPILFSGIEGEFYIDNLVGADPRTHNKLSLKAIKGHIFSRNIMDHVDFDMTAKGQGSSMAMNIVGALDKGFTSDGSLNRQDLSLNFDSTLESLPIQLLCQFACVESGFRNKLEALIGPTLEAKIKAKFQRMNGPLYVSLKGQNGNLNIDAMLNNGYLYLNQNIVAELIVTPQLSKYVLNDLIPVISGMLSADHPLKLTIDKQGFSVPIYDASEKTIALGRATLEMGKVSFSGSSQLAKVLSLLTSANNDRFLVWMTPTYFSLNQGILKLERVDMLISENYPIAAWGSVDFNKERVNMIIALSGAAIDKAFGISGIPASSLLLIPLRGKLDNPSIDKTKAATRLSVLVAQTQGGTQGMVIGTVIDIASGGLTEDPAPSPTTNPLPWAALMKDKPGQDSGTVEKKLMKPLEEVGKGASSLLKKLLK